MHDLDSTYKHINQMTFARLLIPKLMNEDRVLYLDSDLIVDRNIDELFSWNFKDKEILAVPNIFDIKDENKIKAETPAYPINAGVLLINNQELCKEPDLSEKLLDFARKNNFLLDDQDTINKWFKGKIGSLPFTYNYQIGADRTLFWCNVDSAINVLDSIKHPEDNSLYFR